ncbi:MAG: hypothetical protein L0Y39_06115, partial [Methylococcaceae bacterium]|nr:hypothetical protein [Methylococcaceae bacterium]
MMLLVITAWLALSLLATCAFPPQYYAKAGLSDCMSDMTLEEQPSGEHSTPASETCIQSCATDQAKSGLSLTSDTAKGYSLLPLILLWPFACILLLSSLSAVSYPRRGLPSPYKQTSLIYQFCS